MQERYFSPFRARMFEISRSREVEEQSYLLDLSQRKSIKPSSSFGFEPNEIGKGAKTE